jgi:hypothetical protein
LTRQCLRAGACRCVFAETRSQFLAKPSLGGALFERCKIGEVGIAGRLSAGDKVMKVENQNVGNGMDGVMPIKPLSLQPLKRSPHRDLVTHGGLGFDSRVHGRMNAIIGELDLLAAMVFTDQIHPFVLIEREPFPRIRRI